MAKSTPSLLALLGLVAFAGYQNRAKISEMITDARQDVSATGRDDPTRTGGLWSDIERMFAGATGGTSLSGGLSDLISRFRNSGRSAESDSWVSSGPNMPINVDELKNVLGEDTLSELSRKTGLTQSELLLRLNAALPDVVNQFTPDGRIPTQTEAQALT